MRDDGFHQETKRPIMNGSLSILSCRPAIRKRGWGLKGGIYMHSLPRTISKDERTSGRSWRNKRISWGGRFLLKESVALSLLNR